MLRWNTHLLLTVCCFIALEIHKQYALTIINNVIFQTWFDFKFNRSHKINVYHFQGEEPSAWVLCRKMSTLKPISVVVGNEVGSTFFHASHQHGYFGFIGNQRVMLVKICFIYKSFWVCSFKACLYSASLECSCLESDSCGLNPCESGTTGTGFVQHKAGGL